jgi:hypothetical protein
MRVHVTIPEQIVELYQNEAFVLFKSTSWISLFSFYSIIPFLGSFYVPKKDKTSFF